MKYNHMQATLNPNRPDLVLLRVLLGEVGCRTAKGSAAWTFTDIRTSGMAIEFNGYVYHYLFVRPLLTQYAGSTIR